MADLKRLADFFNVLKTEPIRLQNQFQVYVSSGYSEVDRALENITIWATSTAVPGRKVETAPLPYMGYEFKVPTRLSMTQTMNLSIRSDMNMVIRNAFLKWQSYIANPDIEGGSNTEGDKRIPANSFVRIRLLNDKFDTDVNIYKLAGVMPESIGDLQVSNENATPSTFDVSLVFQYWKLETNNSGSFEELK